MSVPAQNQVLMIEGGRPLEGSLRVGGSKNASLPIMAAALMARGTVTLHRVPQIADTDLMAQILRSLGCRVTAEADVVSIDARGLQGSAVDPDLGRRMRASIVLLGPLLARTGSARLPKPGGDEIGMRRVEQHIRGLRQLGAEIHDEGPELVATAPQGLRGTSILLDMPTVTGTENLIMAAVFARGLTQIHNAAREPHVQDLCTFLGRLGARIDGIGTDQITIDGVTRLDGGEHTVVPDYLEAGTYAIAAAAAGGDVTLEGSPTGDLIALLTKMGEAGVDLDIRADSIRVRRSGPLRAVDLVTWVHPGYPTDLQAPYTALMTQAKGVSVVSEYIFENRFQHVPELMRMGARIKMAGRTAIITGPKPLHGTDVQIPDIRSGAALVIAALCAKGPTELRQTWHVERGYEDMVGRLRSLGAQIEYSADTEERSASDVTYE